VGEVYGVSIVAVPLLYRTISLGFNDGWPVRQHDDEARVAETLSSHAGPPVPSEALYA
jgi:hypothetical protein